MCKKEKVIKKLFGLVCVLIFINVSLLYAEIEQKSFKITKGKLEIFEEDLNRKNDDDEEQQKQTSNSETTLEKNGKKENEGEFVIKSDSDDDGLDEVEFDESDFSFIVLWYGIRVAAYLFIPLDLYEADYNYSPYPYFFVQEPLMYEKEEVKGPYFCLGSRYHRHSKELWGYDFFGKAIFLSRFGLVFDYLILDEDDSKNKMKIGEIDFIHNIWLNKNIIIGFKYGVKRVDYLRVSDGFNVGFNVDYAIKKPIVIETTGSHAWINGNSLTDVKLDCVFYWRQLGLGAGYRWLRTEYTSLDGFQFGIKFTW